MTNYIHFSCHSRYINSDESIATNFGFNRINQRHRACLKCRESCKRYREKRIQWEPDYVDRERERTKQWYIDNKERSTVKNKIYDEKYKANYGEEVKESSSIQK